MVMHSIVNMMQRSPDYLQAPENGLSGTPGNSPATVESPPLSKPALSGTSKSHDPGSVSAPNLRIGSFVVLRQHTICFSSPATMKIGGVDLWVCKIQHQASNGLCFLLQYSVLQEESHINLVPRQTQDKFPTIHKRHIESDQVVITFPKLQPAVGPMAWRNTKLQLAGIGSLAAVDLARINAQLLTATTPTKTPLVPPLQSAKSPEQMAVEAVFPDEKATASDAEKALRA